MKGIFVAILIISLQSAIVAAAVIIIKKIFGTRINTRVGYLLWALVLFRLIFPVLPSSPLSIFNAIDIDASAIPSFSQNTPAISRNMDNASSSLPKGDTIDSSNMSTVSRVDEEKTPLRNGPAENIITENTMTILSYIWAAGVLLIIAYLIFVNLLFSSRVKSMRIVELPEDLIKKLKIHTGIRRSIRFVESTEVSSPCVFGVINPVIILPNSFMNGIGDNDLYNILAHEFAHIKHYDLAATWLAYILCAIHWFNPLLWYCSVLIKRDQDLCADAYAMSLLSEDEVMGYGQTLLSIVKNTKTQPFALITAGINESKSTLKQRIKNIAAFSKRKYKLTLFGILLVVLAGVILGTSGMNYPKTSEGKMKFSNNIIMSISSDNTKGFELKIHNNNNLAINNCNLEIYGGNPYVTKSKPIFSDKNFRVSGQKYKSFNLENIDYNNAYIKFNYRIGLAPGNDNILSSFGNIRAFDKTSEVNGWTAASDVEVNAFINDYKINPLAITKIYDFDTIVIFENGSSTGYYELYKDNKSNELISRKVVGYDSVADKPPVQMLGGTAAINYPFVNFKINSPALRALGYKMELITTNGTLISYVAGQTAHTVETRGFGNVNKILIYDKVDKLLYDGEKALFNDVNFRNDDPSFGKVTSEKGFKIINQSPMSSDVTFSHGMFPDKYVVAYKSDDIDWKIPLFTYENTTVYLKCIVESNESPDKLYANFYFIHDISNKPGNILSSCYVNIEQNGEHSYANKVNVKKDVASMRSFGPGDQMAIYLDKSMVEKTKGNFTITFDGLNLISYVPSSMHALDENKKAQIRNMVYSAPSLLSSTPQPKK